MMRKELQAADAAEAQLLRELDASIEEAAARRDERTARYVDIGFWLLTTFSVGLLVIFAKSLYDSPINWTSMFDPEQHATTPGGLSDAKRAHKALEQMTNELVLIGGVMATLLESALYFKNGYNTFEPQIRVLAHQEVTFPHKIPFLATMTLYANGLEDCGRDLAKGISDTAPHIDMATITTGMLREVLQYKVRSKFSYLTDLWWSRSQSKREAETAINDALRSFDKMVEPLWHTVNENMQAFNKTHYHGLDYLSNIAKIEYEIREEIDRQGRYFWLKFWWAGTSPLHEAQKALVPWHYPTGDILAVLQLAQYKLAQVQPKLWPDPTDQSSLYHIQHKIDRREELIAILATLERGRDELEATVLELHQARNAAWRLETRIRMVIPPFNSVDIPIPAAWVALHVQANRAREELLTIEGQKDELGEESN